MSRKLLGVLVALLAISVFCSIPFLYSDSRYNRPAAVSSDTEAELRDSGGRTYAERQEEQRQEEARERKQDLKDSCESPNLLYEEPKDQIFESLSLVELSRVYNNAKLDELKAENDDGNEKRTKLTLYYQALSGFVKVSLQEKATVHDVIRIWTLMERKLPRPTNKDNAYADGMAEFGLSLINVYPDNAQVQNMLVQAQRRLLEVLHADGFNENLRWSNKAILNRTGGKGFADNNDPLSCTDNYRRAGMMYRIAQFQKKEQSIRLWKRVWADLALLDIDCDGTIAAPRPDYAYRLYKELGMEQDALEAAYKMGEKFLIVYLDGLRSSEGERYCPAFQDRFGTPAREWFAKAHQTTQQTDAIVERAARKLAEQSKPKDALALYNQILHDDDAARRVELQIGPTR